jgi:hypothetical protein
MIHNNLFIFRIFAPQDGFVLFFHNGLKIINLVRTGYATTVDELIIIFIVNFVYNNNVTFIN